MHSSACATCPYSIFVCVLLDIIILADDVLIQYLIIYIDSFWSSRRINKFKSKFKQVRMSPVVPSWLNIGVGEKPFKCDVFFITDFTL